MDALLLLLLGVDGGDLGRGGAAEAAEPAEERVVAEAGQGRLDLEAGAVLAEVGIGVLDVGGGEGLDGVLEGGEARYDLVGVSGGTINCLSCM